MMFLTHTAVGGPVDSYTAVMITEPMGYCQVLVCSVTNIED